MPALLCVGQKEKMFNAPKTEKDPMCKIQSPRCYIVYTYIVTFVSATCQIFAHVHLRDWSGTSNVQTQYNL